MVPTYNRPELLERALLSIEVATRAASLVGLVEVIVVDDGHNEEAAARCKKLTRTAPYEIRFRSTSKGPGRGAAAARNEGIAHAQGAYIYLLDDDDEFMPGRFILSLNLLKTGAADVVIERSAVITKTTLGEEISTVVGPGPGASGMHPFKYLIDGNHGVYPGATSFTKESVQRVGGYDERLSGNAKAYAEDIELLMRLAVRAKVVTNSGEPVARIHIHRANTSRPANNKPWDQLKMFGALYESLTEPNEKEYRTEIAKVVAPIVDYLLSTYRLEVAQYTRRLRYACTTLWQMPFGCITQRNMRAFLLCIIGR